jgi:ATP-dependent RNA helicase DeaD
MTSENTIVTTFAELGILPKIVTALNELGYEEPSPIQEQSIPILLSGKDLLAQAATGTGKTGAFALPILNKLDLNEFAPQALILAPTRELAIQVAEAFQTYAKHLSGFRVLPIYGGQDYRGQLNGLKRGAQVVVGTPGRVMDHLRRGTLKLNTLKWIVLDEADEMLNMGFLEDVEWILEQAPDKHQTALFSATMPQSIKKIVDRYMRDAMQVQIKTKATTASLISQFYTVVFREHKIEALTRFLELDDFSAALIFTGTKNASTELASRLEARGYACAAMNGDMKQSQREKVIAQLKKGALDIVVATSVAARGLDVERIDFVINYDVPSDIESYVHRIGRTGRAGRSGRSLLFVTPRELRIVKDIERVTQQTLTAMTPPTLSEINAKRVTNFSNKILGALQSKNLGNYREMVEEIMRKSTSSALDIAAALVELLQKAEDEGISELGTMDNIAPHIRERDPHQYDRNKSRPSTGGSGKKRFSNDRNRSSDRRGSSDRGRSSERPRSSDRPRTTDKPRSFEDKANKAKKKPYGKKFAKPKT